MSGVMAESGDVAHRLELARIRLRHASGAPSRRTLRAPVTADELLAHKIGHVFELCTAADSAAEVCVELLT